MKSSCEVWDIFKFDFDFDFNKKINTFIYSKAILTLYVQFANKWSC